MKPYDDQFARNKPKVHQEDQYYNESDSEELVLPQREPYVPFDIKRKVHNRTSDPFHYDTAKVKSGKRYKLFPLLNI